MLFAPRKGATWINESQKEDTGKKSQDILFSENRFLSLSVWNLLRLTPLVFCSKIFTRHSYFVYWVLVEIWVPESSHKIAINILFVTARAERKVRLCVKLFDFFRGWILIRWTWNLSSFVPNSVEVIGWNFRKKTILWEFFRNFVQSKPILYRNLWNSSLISALSFWVRIALKKIHTGTFVCCLHPGKEPLP